MTQIGMFTREETGFVGRIHTLTLYREITLVPAEPSDTKNAPNFRVHQGTDEGPEIGAGWNRTGGRAGDFIALTIDDPTLPQPIYAFLYHDSDAFWSLHWSRPRKREKQD